MRKCGTAKAAVCQWLQQPKVKEQRNHIRTAYPYALLSELQHALTLPHASLRLRASSAMLVALCDIQTNSNHIIYQLLDQKVTNCLLFSSRSTAMISNREILINEILNSFL